MRWRLRSVRTRILLLVLVPVLSLIGVYAFATVLTARDALNLARSNTVKNATGEPTGAFIAQLDAERMLAMIYLTAPTGANLARLELQESKTNAVSGMLRAALNSPSTMDNASPAEKQAITVLLRDVAGLPSLRSQIAAQIIPRGRAFAAYNTTVNEGDLVLDAAIREQTSAPLVAQALAFVRMGKSEDMLLQENTLLTADLAGGRFTAADRRQFTELVGARRAFYDQTLPDLDQPYRTYYLRDVNPQAMASLSVMENVVVRTTRPHTLPALQPVAWQGAVGSVATGLSAAGTQSADTLTQQAQTQARATYLRLILAGGLGLLAVLVSIFLSLWIGRRQVRELAALRGSALDLANNRLPDVVTRLAAGEHVDMSAEVLPATRSSNEIGQVREAFAKVQQTAVEAAVGQAQLRQGISHIFRNLARRSQSLLHRQLTLLDGMERRARDPQELEDLFKVDHLATRMRRHAESLIILSGESPARGWRHPVPLVDVIRAAVAEVEDYTRIKVTTTTQASLAGPAVGDVIHMIAELAENATVYSPPQTPVSITGSTVGQGFAVEIEDRGLGMSAQHRDEVNAALANPPPFDLSGSDQLGLFVAGQLAKRQNVKISLRPSPYGGTTAIVLIPHILVIPEGSPATPSALPAGGSAFTPARHAIGGGFEPHGRGGARSGAPAASGAGAAPAGWPEPDTQPGWPVPEPALDRWRPETRLPAPASLAGDSPIGDSLASASSMDASLAGDSPIGDSLAGHTGAFAAPAADGNRAASTVPGSTVPGPVLNLTGHPADRAAPPDRDSTQPGLAGAGTAGTAAGLDGTDLDAAGLPRRVRQASLAPQLRETPPRPAPVGDLETIGARTPEDTRVTMSAIQRGWERGRSVFDVSGSDGSVSGSGTDGSGTDGSGTDSSGTDSSSTDSTGTGGTGTGGTGTGGTGTGGTGTDSTGTDSTGTDSTGTDSTGVSGAGDPAGEAGTTAGVAADSAAGLPDGEAGTSGTDSGGE